MVVINTTIQLFHSDNYFPSTSKLYFHLSHVIILRKNYFEKKDAKLLKKTMLLPLKDR